MNPLSIALSYHDRTKHRPNRYAASLGYMDWATQPDPFRSYEGAPRLELPIALEHPTPPCDRLFSNELPVAPLHVKALSQLLQFSLGIAQYKAYGENRWALRMNASSGNLHPSEAYLLLPRVEGLSQEGMIAHYHPKTHALERLGSFTFPDTLPQESFIVVLSSVLWREAWKYGERAWRYCQLDAGHAAQALHVSAAALGWHTKILNILTPKLEALLGLDTPNRFAPLEREHADMALLITPKPLEGELDWEGVSAPPHPYRANTLSPQHHRWEVFDSLETAMQGVIPPFSLPSHPLSSPKSAAEVIKTRRSAQMMDARTSTIALEQLRALLRSSEAPDAQVHLMLFIHRVEGLPRGLYAYVRNLEALQDLRSNLDADFSWEAQGERLYLLREGDFRGVAKAISCNQDIAADGAFSLGMLCAMHRMEANALYYRSLYFECGAIGQQLYLEATAQGLSATGIGCFLDDEMHALLGLRSERYCVFYHFTIGRAIVDMRLLNLPPYERSAL
ncbi:MAG: SagB/ThcOx family dehydrogenase [Campylobacterales bacterium]|nr:SagB/ThcOx family dehydrogenase [Campylobacterales bacterium]